MKRLSVVLLVLTLASLGLGCGGGETPVEQAEEGKAWRRWLRRPRRPRPKPRQL